MSRIKVKLLLVLCAAFLSLGSYTYGAVKINVVTTTTDLADLAKAVGGDRVKVVSLSKGNQDPHFVDPKPSMVMKLKKADLLVKVGMDLDMWADGLIAAARNSKIIYAAKGYVDTSVGIERLEVPKEKIDAGMGHLHIHGNPHYQTDPAAAGPMTKNILDGLCRISPKDGEYFKHNRQEYLTRLDEKMDTWTAKMAKFKGANIVTYHNSWPYFARRFGLNVVEHIEPKPGIPPSPAHLAKLIKVMKEKKVKVILVEPYFPLKACRMVAKKTGAKVLIFPPSVGGIKEIKTYLELFDYNINQLVEALSE
ncbi:MAG: metal ABC transporter substrate-binding protein [bacterium]|nr:metal ABC transporter substrate-binding protein [bacterium]